VAIPVTTDPTYVYLTNDVRQGRSKLRIYWVRSEKLSLAFGGQDISLSELAVRLGSPVTFDRRGQVSWIEEWEDGLGHWVPDVSGAGARAVVSSDVALTGAASLKLVAGSNVNHYASVTRPMAIPKISNTIGIETAYSCDSDVEEAQLLVDVYSGLLSLHWGIKAILATGETALLTAPATWTVIPTGALMPPYANIYNFIQFKWVIVLTTLYYTRLMIANTDFTVSPYAGYMTAPDLTPPHIQITGKNVGVAGNNGIVYCDNFIISLNDPT